MSETGWIVGTENGPIYRAFRYRPGGVLRYLVPTAPNTDSFAAAVNDAGYVAGESHGPVIWSPDGSPTRLGLPPWAVGGIANHINDRGDVVGYFTDNIVGPAAGFVRYAGRQLQLLTLPTGTTWTVGWYVDERGTVFGSAGTPGGWPGTFYVWEDGVPGALPLDPVLGGRPLAFNKCGELVGWGTDGMQQHAIKWQTNC